MGLELTVSSVRSYLILERSIGRPSTLLEEGDNLVEDVIEIHY